MINKFPYNKTREIYFKKYQMSLAGSMNWIPELFLIDPTKEFYMNRRTQIVYSKEELIKDGWVKDND